MVSQMETPSVRYDALNTTLYAEIITLQNKIDKIQNCYYYTDHLINIRPMYKVRFPSDINKYPFKSISNDNTKLRILLSGYYHVIYVDQCKNTHGFEIHDNTNGND